MENLIEKDDDKNDFHKDYLTVYDNNDNNVDNDDNDDNDNNNNDNNNNDNNDNNDDINKKIKKYTNINQIIDKKELINDDKNIHQCELCKKDFKFKYLLEKHKSRKKTCYTIENIIKNYNDKINAIKYDIDYKINKSFEDETTCLFCNKEFLNKANTKKHINISCPNKKELLANIQNLNIEKQKAIEQNKINIQQNELTGLRSTMKDLMNFIGYIKNTN
jgi:hypothetical protein